MKKPSLAFGALLLGFLLSPYSAAALSPIPMDPIKPIDPSAIQIETGIKIPNIDPEIVFDPILIAPEKPEIDLGNLKPVPLDPIVIPPEFFQGPEISNIQALSDGQVIQVTWNTNKPATSKVSYGSTQTYNKALEDLNLKTSHAFIFPVTAGTWHLQVTSQDSLKKETKSADILVVVAQSPNADTPTPTPTQTETATATDSIKNTAETPPVLTSQPPEQTENNLALSAETEAKPVLTTMEIIFGGLALLLAGALIGILINRGRVKPKQE